MPPDRYVLFKSENCPKIEVLTLVTNQNLVFRLKGLFLSNRIPEGLHPGANAQEHVLKLSTDPAIQWKLWLIYLRIYVFFTNLLIPDILESKGNASQVILSKNTQCSVT